MKRWISTAGLAVVLLTISLGSVSAADFTMHDHPDGEYAAFGDYGLRMDTFGSTPETIADVSTMLFSVELGAANVVLSFDPAGLPGGTAILQGSILMTYDSGYTPSAGLLSLYYEMSGLTAAGNGGFNAQSGSGYITDGANLWLFFTGKSDGNSVFTFDNDGHRLPGDPGTGWVGRGWLDNFRACESDDPQDEGCENIQSIGFNDFLLTGTEGRDVPEVPEPSTMLLTMGGVALLWFRKRRS